MARLAHQLAALPWRQRQGVLEILLITSRETKRWVIPKGWPMKRLTSHEAAVQEAYEEAGVRGDIAFTSIGSYSYIKRELDGSGREIQVEVFPLKVVSELKNWPERDERTRAWMPVMEAMMAVDELGLRALMAGFVP